MRTMSSAWPRLVASLGAVTVLAFLAFAACSGSDDNGGNPGRDVLLPDTASPEALFDAEGTDNALPDGAQPDDATPDVPVTDPGGPDLNGGCAPEMATTCRDEHSMYWCNNGTWEFKATCPENWICTNGQCVERTICTPGEHAGCQSNLAQWICNESGTFLDPVACPDGQFCLNGECGNAQCIPGDLKCQDTMVLLQCNGDGTGWEYLQDCPEGEVCTVANCVSACEAAIKNASYIGCKYWTVDLDNYEDPFTNPHPNEVPHTVVIANPGQSPAFLKFEPSDPTFNVPIADPTVPPGEAKAFTMPRWDVDGNGIWRRAIRITSSQPVLAVQFNPFENAAVFSNGSSLLLPEEFLGTEYLVQSWPTNPNKVCGFPDMGNIAPQQGYMTVIAATPGTTQVTVKTTAVIQPSQTDANHIGTPLMNPGDTQTFWLERGQVLNLTALTPCISIGQDMATLDVTGSLITSDKPVAVFGGHEEAVVGWSGVTNGSGYDACCAEHCEQQMIPLVNWADEAVAARSKPRGGEPDVWRIMAGADGVTLTTDPPQAGANNVTLNKGEFVELEAFNSFLAHGTGPIQVVQYTVGQQANDAFIGDPDMVLMVPTSQYRGDYPIAVPKGFAVNYLTLVRSPGTPITIDGAPVSDAIFANVGASGQWQVGWVDVTPGIHNIFAPMPIGVYAYGMDGAVSYGYPAGLDLKVQGQQ